MNNIEITEIKITIIFSLLAYLIDLINGGLEMNLSSSLIFINLCGLYHIYKNLHFNITIRYGN